MLLPSRLKLSRSHCATLPSLESLGVPNTLVITVQDRTTVPVMSLDMPIVVEGNTGSTTEMLFTFSLSAATGRTVSVNYATSNTGATGGASCGDPFIDYETTSGTVSFQPGANSLIIPVKICGDTKGGGIRKRFGLLFQTLPTANLYFLNHLARLSMTIR